MKVGFSAGCSLEVTLKFADYENVKPNFWAGVTLEWEQDKTLTEDAVRDSITYWQGVCREICESQIDKDIYDVKKVKVFEQLNKKGGK